MTLGTCDDRQDPTDIVEKVVVAAAHGICIEWCSAKALKVNPDSARRATVERDSIVGADFAVHRTFSTISTPCRPSLKGGQGKVVTQCRLSGADFPLKPELPRYPAFNDPLVTFVPRAAMASRRNPVLGPAVLPVRRPVSQI